MKNVEIQQTKPNIFKADTIPQNISKNITGKNAIVTDSQQILPKVNSTTVKQPPATPKVVTNDTTYYYYKTGTVSVKITPWYESKRHLLIFNRQNELTYNIEEVRSSYVVSTELKFKDNGSVNEANIHTSPDASMYWYESIITFSDNNEPEWKTDKRFPENTITMPGNNASYWNKEKQTWVKQQAME